MTMDMKMLEHEFEHGLQIAEMYSEKIPFLYDEIKRNVFREEYGKGGELLHRGYYCPSPIFDIVVGNVSRGRLLKRPTSNSNPTYRYGFDDNGNLLTVIHPNGTEIIIRQGEMEIGIDFDAENEIQAICWCIFSNGTIQSYVFSLYHSFEKKIAEYRRENYIYSKNGLTSVDWYECVYDGKRPIMIHDKYHFIHDGEGFLSQYTVDEYDWEVSKDSVWKDHVFEVRTKRRV